MTEYKNVICDNCERKYASVNLDTETLKCECGHEIRLVLVYDSTTDTLAHIDRVKNLLGEVSIAIEGRGLIHDASKLSAGEKPIFDEMTPKLKGCTFGSDEYKGFLKEMGVALEHHYNANSHHPEHFKKNGIEGMTLVDLMEMLADWKAASERHADGDIKKSLEINEKRFNIPESLMQILWNTVKALGWHG
jgi:hypothetical protein